MKDLVKDGRIDVGLVMARIREKVRGRRDQGLYTDEEVEELTALKLQAFADEAEIDPDLLARLMAVDHNWNIAVDFRIETHRSGWTGPVIVFVKKLIRPLVRLYTDNLFSRQAQINLYLRYLCHHLVREMVRQQLEQTALRNRVERLEKELGRTPRDGGA